MESNIRSLEYRNERNIESIKRDYQKQKDSLERKINIYQNIAEGSIPFKYSATLVADMNVVIYAEAADYLRNKERPAWKTADKVKQLSNRTKEAIAKERAATYKMEMLLKLFPEIRRYFDEDDALMSLAECDSYQSFVEKRDRSRDYLTEEEWNQMSVDERNQLALDRWKERPKSNWTIGMLYEMYIGSLLRPKHFNVIQFGILKGLNDLGRDIIARRKDPDGIERIYIIQCKIWSQKKEIHENVVCQLFGTAIEFQIENKCTEKQQVIPTLYVTTRLSPMAMEFAKKLGVLVNVVPLGDFPMIKCNLNNGNRIYHLPFDQQYWNTKIEKDGEFYANTVAEAVNKGFRRAFRFRG